MEDHEAAESIVDAAARKEESPEQHIEQPAQQAHDENLLALRLARCQSQTAGTDLDLSSLALRDIPLEVLTRFPNLKRLNVRRNQLTHLPDELVRQLPHLTVLSASGNALSELPDHIGALRSLQKLLLEDNCLTALPASISKLHALEELDVRSNQLEALDDDLGNHLPNLKTLLLGGNERLRVISCSLGNLASLRIVDLSGIGELESAPEKLRRLHERNVIMHSRTKRRELIARALRVRSAVAQTLSTSALVSK